ncbi:hypothetical protein CRUP_022902 [Coryphaenoides rupestris]|nr:hypothetical protein CRUP_022902 [Coryphaenoides rupestris]
MSKGILQVHPPICDCPGCRISSPVNRGRLAEKRTIPLPPNRVPKKELASIFSSDDSEGSERAVCDHAHIKQEEELHYNIMRKSRDSDLSTIISNLHHTRQHGMPEGQSASDHSSSNTGHTEDLLGKRRTHSPNSSSECPSDSKKSRSASPKENSQSLVVEAGAGGHSPMSPEEQYRRMMSALSQHGTYEEQQQRLYQLASTMGLPTHDMLRARQEAMAAAVRSSGVLEAHLPSAGSSSSSSSSSSTSSSDPAPPPPCDPGTPKAKPCPPPAPACPEAAGGVAPTTTTTTAAATALDTLLVGSQKRKARKNKITHLVRTADGSVSPIEEDKAKELELSHPPPLLSPQSAQHIALGAHLRPPFLGMPSTLCQAPGYGFLQPAQAEIFARQQELLRKQNLARLEMSAEILRQKELESLHQRGQGRLLTSDLLAAGALSAGLPPDHPALRSLHDVPEGHPLREELARRSNAMLLLRHGTTGTTPLLGLNPHPQQPGAPPSSSSASAHKDSPARSADSRKSSRRGPQAQLRAGDHTGGGGGGGGGGGRGGKEQRGREADRDEEEEEAEAEQDEEEEEEQHDAEMKESDSDADDEDEERRKGGASKAGRSKAVAREMGEGLGRLSASCSSVGGESPGRHLLSQGVGKMEGKYALPSGFLPPLPGLHTQSLPFSFPYASPYLVSVCVCVCVCECVAGGWLKRLCLCQVFREQAIDGETLPLLSEEHLLSTLGVHTHTRGRLSLCFLRVCVCVCVCVNSSSVLCCWRECVCVCVCVCVWLFRGVCVYVARRLGRIFYMTSFPLALPLPPSAMPTRLTERERDTPSETPLSLAMAHHGTLRPASSSPPGGGSSPFSGGASAPLGRSAPKQENGGSAAAGGGYRESKTPS